MTITGQQSFSTKPQPWWTFAERTMMSPRRMGPLMVVAHHLLQLHVSTHVRRKILTIQPGSRGTDRQGDNEPLTSTCPPPAKSTREGPLKVVGVEALKLMVVVAWSLWAPPHGGDPFSPPCGVTSWQMVTGAEKGANCSRSSFIAGGAWGRAVGVNGLEGSSRV